MRYGSQTITFTPLNYSVQWLFTGYNTISAISCQTVLITPEGDPGPPDTPQPPSAVPPHFPHLPLPRQPLICSLLLWTCLIQTVHTNGIILCGLW